MAGGVWAEGMARLRQDYDASTDVGLAHLIGRDAFDQAMHRLEADLDTPRAQPPGSALADRLIVIVGCGRSGTTWLHGLLLSHPQVIGAPSHESWLFAQLESLWQRFGQGDVDIDEAQFVAALRTFSDTVLSAPALPRPPARPLFAVEKTPVHSYYLHHIAAVYPDAWFVHVLRDGRDVARSISRTPFFQIPDPGDAAALWSRVVHAIDDAAPTLRRFRELRYERLLAQPEPMLTGLLDWLGLDTGEAAVRSVFDKIPQRVSMHAGKDAPLGGRTWTSLPRRDVRHIYRRAGSDLRRLGYASRGQLALGRILGR